MRDARAVRISALRAVAGLFFAGSIWGTLFIQPAVAFCEPNSVPLPADLDSIRGAVKQIETELLTIERQLKALKKRQAELAQQIEELRLGREQAARDLDQAQTEAVRIEREMTQLELELKRSERLSAARIRALYKQSFASLIERLARADGGAGFDQNLYYMMKIRRADQQLLRRNRRLRAGLSRKRAEIERLVAFHRAARLDLEGKETELVRLLEQQASQARQLADRKRSQESKLGALKAQAERLQKVVSALTGGEPAAVGAPGPPRAQSMAPSVGLSAAGGRMTPPLNGKVIRGYGRHRLAEFTDYIFNKGVEMIAQPGSVVRAAAAGRVVFSGAMPGFGPVVIVDHGQREFTLYGCLEEVLVRAGDVVGAGDAVARVGKPDKRGRNFYFEVRKGGVPLNPEDVFGGGFTGKTAAAP